MAALVQALVAAASSEGPGEAREVAERAAGAEMKDSPGTVDASTEEARMQFFFPDGDGGSFPAEKAERLYAAAKKHVEVESFWGGTFTDRRVHSVTSHHNGTDFRQVVGELTRDKKLVLAIFESEDERGRRRFVVQSITSTIHVDNEKIVDFAFFD